MIFTLSLLVGFIVNVLIGTLVAQLIANPLTKEIMHKFERNKKDLKMVPLLSGYLLITLTMVLFYPYFGLEATWLFKGLVLGLFSGIISFVSTYLIISGWSILPPKQMFISGIVDIASTICTGIAIAYIHTYQP